ncbi:MAG TPA: GH1 family beta-glucosidase [Thermoanaerobaculia bacterium]|nr:GH1 family beta-glucosidase [Thermoanaerobaculia bacterium]
MNHSSLFPEGFLWGAAVSAYQVEGSPLADGAGPSIWHRFSHTPGLVPDGDTGDVACDFYRRYGDDVRLMRELGLTAFRFSVSWSRVIPEGRGSLNLKGLDFYERLVDALLANGIRPLVTLFHWDLPAALDDRGGWLNPDIAEWFADYARVLFRALDDRVELWTTLNEPWVVTDGGYLHGKLAPGHRSLFEAPIASHNLLRAHAAGVAAYRAEGRHRIGLVVNLEPKYSASESPEDLAATRRADAYMNRQFLDPVFLGRYPEELPGIFGPAWPDFPATDFDAIRQPIDFLGVNYYTRGVVQNETNAWPVGAARVRQAGRHTEMDWEVYPEGLFDTLRWVRERYGAIPLYVTENGAAFEDPPPSDGTVEDPLRVSYLREHLLAARRALAAGVDLRGYFVWSLLDNFEWSHGTSKRFGLIRVDYDTQKRTPKASARFYSRVIQSKGAALEELVGIPSLG